MVGQPDFGRVGRLSDSDDPPYPLRSSVDTGAGNRNEAPDEFTVVRGSAGCRRAVGAVVLSRGETLPSKNTRGLHPTPSFQPRGCVTDHTKCVHVRRRTRIHPTSRRVRCLPNTVCAKSVEHLDPAVSVLAFLDACSMPAIRPTQAAERARGTRPPPS